MGWKANAIVFEDIDKVCIRTLELAPCGTSEIVCETIFTFVSPGTELRVLGGHYSTKKDFPLVPGYSAIAKVVEVGAEVKGFKVGDLVSGRNPRPIPGIKSMWGGQAGFHVCATIGEDRAVLLPHGAEPLDYVVAEVAAISFRGVEVANPVAGETAVVIGQGLIGAFSAAWLIDRGCRVIVCDVDQGRLERARKRGVADGEHGRGKCHGPPCSHLQRRGGHRGGKLWHFRRCAGLIPDAPQEAAGLWRGLQGRTNRQKTIEAIRKGRLKAEDFIDADEAYRGLEIMLGIYESARQRRTLTPPFTMDEPPGPPTTLS